MTGLMGFTVQCHETVPEDLHVQLLGEHATFWTDGYISYQGVIPKRQHRHELRTMLPFGVELYTNRVANVNPTTVENLRNMAPDIGRAASGIVPDVDLDVMIYGCTADDSGALCAEFRRLRQKRRNRSAGASSSHREGE